MSLTLAHGPLAATPAASNYRLAGPDHRLFFEAFPRRVRAVLAGETVLDTRAGKLLHETGLLPQLYVPRADVRGECLEKTAHTSHCPFKGDAEYWSLAARDRVAENAAWAYPNPLEPAAWLAGYLAFHWEALDAWFDEDEEVRGHLRDPYHRVDVRAASRHVRVAVADETVAEADRAKIVSETGLPNRYYLPMQDVRREWLAPSDRHTICPYKGRASYYSLEIGERRLDNIAWFYPEPLEDALKLRDHLCFSGDGIAVEVDGERLP